MWGKHTSKRKKFELSQLNGNFEDFIYSKILDAYETQNGDEYYLIIQLMKGTTPERSEIIKNALIIINTLFFVKKRARSHKHPDSQTDINILKILCNHEG